MSAITSTTSTPGCGAWRRKTGRTPRTAMGIASPSRCCFFFQAEDGIRDVAVTGVQTCALPIYCRDGLFGAAEFVVRPRHLIEDLVAVLVTGVFGEQPIVKSNCLEWTFGICASAHRVRRGSASVTDCQDSGLRGRAPLEILIGFFYTRTGSWRGGIRTPGPRACEYRGGLRSGHFPRLGVARANPELLLKLQVREAPHRLRSHRGLRCLLKEAPVLLHGLIEALFDFHFLQVRTHVPQLRQRPRGPHWLDGTRGATDHENRRDHYRNGEVTHQCPPASDCARAARS